MMSCYSMETMAAEFALLTGPAELIAA